MVRSCMFWGSYPASTNMIICFPPTCQVRVVPPSFLLHPSVLLPPLLAEPQLQALDRSVPRRTPTAMFPARPPPQAPDQSVPRRASTASSGSKCSPLDFNRELRIRVFPAGPQPQRIPQDMPDRMPEKNVRIDSR